MVKLFAKITTGDYDAVIIGHSELVKLPMSEDRQARLIEKEIDELKNDNLQIMTESLSFGIDKKYKKLVK